MKSVCQIAFECSHVSAYAELIDEAGHEAAQHMLIVCRPQFSFRLMGNVHDLLESLVYLPCNLPVDAVTPADFDVKPIVPGELPRTHQQEEIRIRAAFEQLARFGDVLVVAPEPHQQIAPADQRGAQRRGRNAVVFRRFHQHA